MPSSALAPAALPRLAARAPVVGATFAGRVKALFWVHLALLGLALGVAGAPPLAASFGLHGAGVPWVLSALLLLGAACRFAVDSPRLCAALAWLTLCTDAAAVAWMILASGGLYSPLLPTQLGVAAVFALLFPRPLAAAPALLPLPVVARVDLAARLPPAQAAADLLLLLWLGALHVAVVGLVIHLHRREEARRREVEGLQEELRALAVHEERARISREIHDGVGASLSTLVLQAELASGLAGEGPVASEVRELKRTADEAIEELRRSLRILRDDLDLAPALADLCAAFASRTGLRVGFSADGPPPPLPREAQLCAVRVAQEALTNALRHGGGAPVEVSLGSDGDRCRLSVRDEGPGFDPAAVPRGHYGLAGMRERAARCGGRLEIESASGRGTTIRLELGGI